VEDGADGPGYYAAPEAQYIGGIFYNKDVFEDHGIDIPQTWDEFMGPARP
jgi:ABC-type glycerol-3-phosphate transport system substrate-binding protein